MKRVDTFFLCAIICLLSSCAITVKNEIKTRAISEIDELVENYRKAYIEGDWEFISSITSEEMTVISKGEIYRFDRKKMIEIRKRQFSNRNYIVRNLEDPIINVSDDGTVAWVISVTAASSAEKGNEEYQEEITNASVLVFQKTNGTWYLVAVGETEK